jgi:CBS domain-containing protein
MTQPVVVVREDSTLKEIAKTMLERRIACVPVVNESGAIVGIVTESDFTAKEKRMPFTKYSLPQLFGQYLSDGEVDPIYQASRSITAREIMSEHVITVTEDDLVRMVLEKMLQHNVNHVPVVKDGEPVGIVARHDLLKMMLAGEYKEDPANSLE